MRSSDLGRATALAATLCAACQFDSSPAFSHLDPGAPATTDGAKSLGDFGKPPADDPAPDADGTNSMNNTMPPAMNVPDASTVPIDSAPAHDAGSIDAGSVLADAAVVVMDAAADADADQDADDPDIMLPEPGTAYARCGQTADCNSGLICTADLRGGPSTTNGVPDGYCMPLCTVNANQTNLECPQPTSGTVEAECDFNTSLCALGSCEHAECPDGMECVDSSVLTSSGYVFHIFECLPLPA